MAYKESYIEPYKGFIRETNGKSEMWWFGAARAAVRSGIDQKQLLEAYPCARSASGAPGVDSRAEIARSGISMQIFDEQW